MKICDDASSFPSLWNISIELELRMRDPLPSLPRKISVLTNWYRKRERGTFPFAFGFHPNTAAVRLYDLLGDVEPETGAVRMDARNVLMCIYTHRTTVIAPQDAVVRTS